MDKERRKLIVKGLGGISAVALLSATSSEWAKPVVKSLISSSEAQTTGSSTPPPPTTLAPTAVPTTTTVTLLAMLSGLLWFGKKFHKK